MENKIENNGKRECSSAMDGQKLALSVGLIILALACFVIGTIAVAIPYWGNYRNRVCAYSDYDLNKNIIFFYLVNLLKVVHIWELKVS